MDQHRFAHLDRRHQIIRQTVPAHMTVEIVNEMIRQTAACVAQLDDPSRVRILADTTGVKKSDPAARKILAEQLHRADVHKIATVSPRAMERTVIKFYQFIAGTQKIQAFKTEAKALAWLLDQDR